jgi:SWI/SNF-related matrix-associated actin-dependent regulator 1 of chromatin subfamily A
MTNDLKIPYGKTLYPFQIETIRKTLHFLRQNESHACYVANEMGLGKSVTSLVTANTLKSERVLIICPAVMRLVWEQEIYAWCRITTNSVPKVKVVLSSNDLHGVATASFVICSYSLIVDQKVLAALTKGNETCWDLLICDEAHALKNKKAKRTRAVIQDIWPKCVNKVFLSGTPMTRNVVDCYVPFHAILPKSFPSFASFVESYSHMRITQWGIDYYGLRNHEELSQIIRSNFYIRYRKEDVLTELPPKVWQKIQLPPEYSVKVQASNAEKLRKEKQQILDYISQDKGVIVPASMAEHRRLQGEAKVPAVLQFAEDLLEQEIPIVIFGYHKAVIAALQTGLAKFNPVVITGETSSVERQEAITSFQSGNTNCFIGNIVAAGSGITLTRSCTVIFAELDWVPATLAQASDRVHRIGQKDQVTIYFFVVEDSIDSTIEELVVNRARDFKKLLDEPT